MSLHCINCDGILTGPICEYCGRQVQEITKVDEEKERLNEFNKKLKNNDEDELGQLLVHGFMPETPEGLLAAGLDMLPIIAADELSYDHMKAAVGRLSAITTRLKLGEQTEVIQKAISEFERVVADYKRTDRNLGIGCGVAIVIALGIGLWLLIQFMN